ncbi:M-phase inducer phosphatase [Phlebotomus argentipes]|uniref:M-phase inducer phosphatase n=1 Tax=Phlebotomus argentipes TaxID=94469 RepID=UPI00289321EF|nr:M-phase inducer phosphatase [Phlebotomus argentipes]
MSDSNDASDGEKGLSLPEDSCALGDDDKSFQEFFSELRQKQFVSSESHVSDSPITDLSHDLCLASLKTPCVASLDHDECRDLIPTADSGISNSYQSEEKSTGLINNSFNLSTGSRSATMRRGESRVRGSRRPNITPLCISYDSPEKEAMSTEDLSLYAGSSPQASPRPCSISPSMEMGGLLSPEVSPSRFRMPVEEVSVSQTAPRRSFEEIDANSMDSGYSASFGASEGGAENKGAFEFAQPLGLAPRRVDPSPRKTPTTSRSFSSPQNRTPTNRGFRVFSSLSSGSMESMDDDYMELFDIETMDCESQMPSNITSLISGDIKTLRSTPESKRPLVRRCLSLVDSTDSQRVAIEPKTPDFMSPLRMSMVRNVTIRSEESTKAFKRPEPLVGSPVQSKRYKSELNVSMDMSPLTPIFGAQDKENARDKSNLPKRNILKKSISLNETVIMSALTRSMTNPDLIGDFSKPFCLPLLESGRHKDLKSISVQTMAKLLNGAFGDSVASFKIIDCRYPYEYEGGHIAGSMNLYTQEQILEELVTTKTEVADMSDGKRHILVFHCEFSSERGPKLSRFLRNHDRHCNENSYPALHYPEIYLLHGGYKEFYEIFPDLCEPQTYRQMLDPGFSEEYKHFRAKTKSWTGEGKATASNRVMKSRSRLML